MLNSFIRKTKIKTVALLFYFILFYRLFAFKIMAKGKCREEEKD